MKTSRRSFLGDLLTLSPTRATVIAPGLNAQPALASSKKGLADAKGTIYINRKPAMVDDKVKHGDRIVTGWLYRLHLRQLPYRRPMSRNRELPRRSKPKQGCEQKPGKIEWQDDSGISRSKSAGNTLLNGKRCYPHRYQPG